MPTPAILQSPAAGIGLKRGFDTLARLVAGADGQLLAFGPWENLYRSKDGGASWARVEGVAEGSSRELPHSPDGVQWQPVGEGLAGQTWQDFVVVGRTVYLLATGGVIWRREL